MICPPLLDFFGSSSILKSDDCPIQKLKTLLIQTYFLLKQTKKPETTRIVV